MDNEPLKSDEPVNGKEAKIDNTNNNPVQEGKHVDAPQDHTEKPSESHDDELDRLRKENERLKEIQKLREENAKMSSSPSQNQQPKSNISRIILGGLAVVIIALAVIYFVNPFSLHSSVTGLASGTVQFTSPITNGVTSSNLGTEPLPVGATANFSNINNSKSSLSFFLGPIGTPEPSFISNLSALDAQLSAVGSEQINSTVQCLKASNSSNGQSSPAFCVLVMPDHNYDLIPIKVGGNSTVAVNGSKVTSIPKLTYNGKATFVYMGAQGCPFCAQERYVVAIALSRFGNFTKLFYDRSATNDGNIPTFTFDFNSQLFYDGVSGAPSSSAPYGDSHQTPFFVGAYYNSSYINFIPIDQIGSSFLTNITGISHVSPFVFNNVVVPSQAFSTYHGFAINNFLVGGVPFIDINNQYVFDGANMNANILFSNTSSFSQHSDIFNTLQNPSQGSVGETVLGAANILTAQICDTINNTAPVCSLSYIKGIEGKINGLGI